MTGTIAGASHPASVSSHKGSGLRSGLGSGQYKEVGNGEAEIGCDDEEV